MQVKTLVSVLAVATAFSFAGPAFAQTTYNGVEVSATDLPKLQARCDELASNESSTSLAEGADGDSNTGDSAASADATTTETPQVDEIDQATSTIDLDTVTLEACTTAGLTK